MESEKGINSYGSIYALGHVAVADILDGEVEITEKVDGCVDPNTPILCADLSYRPAGDLRPGDKIIGFEHSGQGHSGRWRLVEGFVTANVPIIKHCAIVKTTSRTVVASLDHPWLLRSRFNYQKKMTKRWIETDNLRPGDKILSMPVWSPELSWESGYLAGQFDGEGCLVRNGKYGRFLRYYQNGELGSELYYVEQLLKDRGYELGLHIRQRENPAWKLSGSIQVNGAWPEILRFLGTHGPRRLLADSKKIWEGASINAMGDETVVSITPIGDHTVSGLSTSCETYIANGLLSHNSQLSFALIDGELLIRSKNQQLHGGADNGMFNQAVVKIHEARELLTPGYVYRGEYFSKPKHNTLNYERIPKNNIAIYDIERSPGSSDYLRHRERNKETIRIGFEPVRVFFVGSGATFDLIKVYLENHAALGNVKVEGIVVKNYSKFTEDKKVAKAKFVSAEFQEKHQKAWKETNPTRKDIISEIIDTYAVPARWQKSVQHLRDDGNLEGSPRDIGNLIKEAQEDLKKEEAEAIKDTLYKHFIGQITRGSIAGLPVWYKEQIAEGNINL